MWDYNVDFTCPNCSHIKHHDNCELKAILDEAMKIEECDDNNRT